MTPDEVRLLLDRDDLRIPATARPSRLLHHPRHCDSGVVMDGFVVDDPKRFPVPPGGLRTNTIAISIMPTAVDASPEAIIGAMRASWPGGDIKEGIARLPARRCIEAAALAGRLVFCCTAAILRA